jgi:DEAD/DEAH box helicase domain-containing protein
MISDFTPYSVAKIATEAGFQIIEHVRLPGREPEYVQVPLRLHGGVRDYLNSHYPRGLYAHQAQAIEAALDGSDVCLSTSTASGKSLVFLAVAADLLQRDQSVRVLALYPARALIQDQTDKWAAVLNSIGMHHGYIDGGVPAERRLGILRASQVVLMTPDVAHAWLLSHLGEKEVSAFLARVRLLVLDEAHVYEGVFGTNMAYFLRRLQVASGPHQLICSTATLGRPADFVSQLTGRQPRSFSLEDDRSATPPKTILLAKEIGGKPFDSIVNLLGRLGRAQRGRFLAFGDSRRMVEQLVAAVHRSLGAPDDDEDLPEPDAGPPQEHAGLALGSGPRILPYRAGYETEDRNEIQKALARGHLAGVVATSAMELGLDIGEIDLIVLAGVPPSAKAFWQRLGRAGRRNPGVCLLIDDRGTLLNSPGTLRQYLERALEASWLYLENRYIQYANALCAAFELNELGRGDSQASPFTSLPPSFRKLLENELNPTEIVPTDLYPLKQRAQAGPHREFPIRSGMEQDFQVQTSQGLQLGNLTFSQALREAYPGSIYYYMARPYRVYRFNYKNGEVHAKRERRWTTRPIAQTMVFPRFQGGILGLWRSESGFLAEAEMQVSERVLGFTEQRGSNREEHRYGPASPYYQRNLNRFFETTGVCWYFPEKHLTSDDIAAYILKAFCVEFGIQQRDLGVGLFHAKHSPLGFEKCQGACIFDATNGSLRLTQRLAERFPDVLEAAISIAHNHDDHLVPVLTGLAGKVEGLRPAVSGEPSRIVSEAESDWVVVIAPGEKAIYLSEDGPIEVKVVGFRYTPHGLMYELEPQAPDDKWRVISTAIQSIHGQTRLLRTNLLTGETEPVA